MFGTTSRQLGMIAVAQRHYASLNPNADLRTPLSLEEYERSPLLIAPLRKYDLAYLFDGGAAFVVAALSVGTRSYCLSGADYGAWRKPTRESILATVPIWSPPPPHQRNNQEQEAFRAAGVGPQDIDVALLYDDTTYGVLVQLEDYGFCAKGEGGSFVEAGQLGPGGATARELTWWQFIPGASRWHVTYCRSRTPITWPGRALPGARGCGGFGERFGWRVCQPVRPRFWGRSVSEGEQQARESTDVEMWKCHTTGQAVTHP